ncbi:nucleoside triphosphate pyrophosphohydrolase [Glaciecola sp. KUL10]|uniref:nucleoside triphosphate pyrophosphohydrolase n=1 Tax=Glaciecola sp. (strain KUL10) TaxID=2161813 RepID=UPI000D789FFE|nr:nucleoside triphosphate pyrophosphohydrolase [Glaciecola sp. KUL10]GBL06311.1 MazG family protein [Glaciecola sp. KUL10]
MANHYPHKTQHIIKLLDIMSKLRDPLSGCEWDLKQDFNSIIPHTIEEAYEVADAIENGTMDDVCDELGDLLFQVVFYAQLAAEQDSFVFDDVAERISNKLIRRHPHIFAQQTPLANKKAGDWDEIKKQERREKGETDSSIFAGLTAGLPPLIKATKLQKKCAKVGFDWDDIPPVIDKVREEIIEIEEELAKPVKQADLIEEEVGDLFFACVNLARHLNVDAERALSKANTKFETRFRHVEDAVKFEGKEIKQCSLDELERHWVRAKKIKIKSKKVNK